MTSELAGIRKGAAPTTPSRVFAIGQLLLFLVLAAVLIPALSPSATVGHGLVVKLFFLARILVLLAAATWFLRIQHRTWADVGLRKPHWWKTLFAIPLGAGAAAIAVGVVSALVYRAGVHAADYGMFAPLRGNLGEYLFWGILVTWGTAAFGEELLFRGFVLRSVKLALGGSEQFATTGAVVIQAIIFGALHFYQGPGGVATAGAIGLVLGFVWLFTDRNLWAGIVIHGLFDFASMTALYLGAMPHR